MWGAIAGAGLSAVGSIVGAIASAREMRKARAQIAQQKQKNQTWYDKNYNMDYTQRADVQNVLNRTRQLANERRKRVADSAVVTGATDEAVAMENEAQNNMIADTMSNINAQADNYKNQVENQYRATDADLTQQEINTHINQAQNISNAAGQASRAGASIVGSIFDKK